MSEEETIEEKRARWRSVGVSAEALPTRQPDNRSQWQRMKKWEKEHAAARQIAKTEHKADLKSLKDAPEMLKKLGG